MVLAIRAWFAISQGVAISYMDAVVVVVLVLRLEVNS